MENLLFIAETLPINIFLSYTAFGFTDIWDVNKFAVREVPLIINHLLKKQTDFQRELKYARMINKFDYIIKTENNLWEVVIGLEVHAQVLSESKLFSTSSTKFGSEPNTQVSLVDAAFPGMLPVINEHCIKQAIKTGIGLKAKINKRSIFDRKNYFYADLPQGYQISQYKNPIVGEGSVILDMPDGEKTIGIERLHLEQDAGKSIHDIDPKNTLVDLNRSGVALMEIVSKPDLRSLDEVNAYIKKLRSIMRYLGTCDGNMQEGSLRADVNVSVRKKGVLKLGTRCEIKNVNSIKFMQMAIDYEANRQVDILEEGGSIDQETRLFDTKKNETRSMRTKEDAHDYRYFPDPDLLPLELNDKFIDDIKKDIPELPDEKKKRFIEKFKLRTIGFSDVIKINDSFELQEAIEDSYNSVGINETACIVMSNKRASIYNKQIRTEILGRNSEINVDDILMVVKNNYFWLDDTYESGFIANGDIIKVIGINSLKKLYGFSFAEIMVKMIDYPNQPSFNTVVILDTLQSDSPALSFDENKILYEKVKAVSYTHLTLPTKA